MKPQLIHVIENLKTGGAEILLINTINELPEYRHTIVCLFEGNELAKRISPEVEIICLLHTGWKGFFATVKRLHKIIRERSPLLVHSHLFVSTICARLATPKSIPVLTTLHSTYSIDSFKQNKLSILAENVTLRNRHTLIGVSNFVLDDYFRYVFFKGKRFALYNFLPEAAFGFQEPDANANELRCVALGNLKAAKNYFYLLEIFGHLKSKTVTLDIYGEGPLRDELQKKIDQHVLPVKLCGRVSDAAETLKSYDLFIQASEHEGFGLSVVEAMAVGLPMIVSDIPVFHEVTQMHSFFFPLNDSTKAAGIIEELLDKPELRVSKIREAFQYCRNTYNREVYKKKLLNIYTQVSAAK